MAAAPAATHAQESMGRTDFYLKVISETVYIPAPSKVQTQEKSVDQLASTLVVHNVAVDVTMTMV